MEAWDPICNSRGSRCYRVLGKVCEKIGGFLQSIDGVPLDDIDDETLFCFHLNEGRHARIREA